VPKNIWQVNEADFACPRVRTCNRGEWGNFVALNLQGIPNLSKITKLDIIVYKKIIINDD